jgi:hypothetical protein
VSGDNSGDSISITASGAPITVEITANDTPIQLDITGSSTVENINVSIEEGVRPSAIGPFDTFFAYNAGGQLIQKVDNTTTDFYYNVIGQLTQLSRPDYTKDFYYNDIGQLTGVDVDIDVGGTGLPMLDAGGFQMLDAGGNVLLDAPN